VANGSKESGVHVRQLLNEALQCVGGKKKKKKKISGVHSYVL